MTIYIPISKEIVITFLVTNLIWLLIFGYKRLKIKFMKQAANNSRLNNQGMYQSYHSVVPQYTQVQQPSMYDQYLSSQQQSCIYEQYKAAQQTPMQESDVKNTEKAH